MSVEKDQCMMAGVTMVGTQPEGTITHCGSQRGSGDGVHGVARDGYDDKTAAEVRHANPYTLSPSEVGAKLGAKHVALQEAMGRHTGESIFDAQRPAALGGMPIMRDFEPVATPVTQRLTFRGLHTTPGRVFTREEVLTVLRTLKATTGVAAGKEALDVALRAVEGME